MRSSQVSCISISARSAVHQHYVARRFNSVFPKPPALTYIRAVSETLSVRSRLFSRPVCLPVLSKKEIFMFGAMFGAMLEKVRACVHAAHRATYEEPFENLFSQRRLTSKMSADNILLATARSSSGSGRRPLKAEITSSNLVRATKNQEAGKQGCLPALFILGLQGYSASGRRVFRFYSSQEHIESRAIRQTRPARR